MVDKFAVIRKKFRSDWNDVLKVVNTILALSNIYLHLDRVEQKIFPESEIKWQDLMLDGDDWLHSWETFPILNEVFKIVIKFLCI